MAHKTQKELLLEIKKLEKQIEKLIDENSSLWFMLDELDKSNITNPEYFKHIAEAVESIRKSKLMTPKEVGEA
jgi:arsenate reductase-like glutaredoxin family protein|tara:strand:+ start:659 stop:877 length:219 start_codon:yes stop_codon:yes gene_type:complete